MSKKKGTKKTFDRGMDSENRVYNALCVLKDRGVITSFIRHQRGGYEDGSGVDFTVYLIRDEKIKHVRLQVKSSQYFIDQTKKKYDPGILMILGQLDPQMLLLRLKKLIGF